MKMTGESTTDIMVKYAALKDERDALKTQLDAITATNDKRRIVTGKQIGRAHV